MLILSSARILFFLLERKARHSCRIVKEQLLFLVPAFLSNYQAPHLLSSFSLSPSPLIVIIRWQTTTSLVMRGYCHLEVIWSFSFWLSLSDFMRSCFSLILPFLDDINGRWRFWRYWLALSAFSSSLPFFLFSNIIILKNEKGWMPPLMYRLSYSLCLLLDQYYLSTIRVLHRLQPKFDVKMRCSNRNLVANLQIFVDWHCITSSVEGEEGETRRGTSNDNEIKDWIGSN